jgi:choline dehydrogenase-like flavoprotein
MKSAWQELGVKDADTSNGSIKGLTEFKENAKNGLRQPSYAAYPLDSVTVLTDTVVHRIVFDDAKRATSVLLGSGQTISAVQEIVLCCGAYRTPQLLQLSGVGDPDLLAQHSIPIIHASPNIGKNLYDHFAIFLAFKLADPSGGYALGSPSWTSPPLYKGLPFDWVVSEPLPPALLSKIPNLPDQTAYENRNLYEILAIYAPPGIPGIPVDGTHIATSAMLLLPTSRGTVTLRTADAMDTPKIEPHYLSTDLDRAALLHATKRTLNAMLGTASLSSFIGSETPPSGVQGLDDLAPLTLDASDEVLMDGRAAPSFGGDGGHGNSVRY